MKNFARASIPSALLAALMAGILVPSVEAAGVLVIGSNYAGYVSGTATGTYPADVATNDLISNSSTFDYAPSQAGLPTGGKYIFTTTTQQQTASVAVNYPTPNDFNSSGWSANYVEGVSGASFYVQMSKSGSTVTMEIFASTNGGTGTTKSGAYIELFLTSTTYTTATLPTTQAELNEFLTTTAKLVWDPPPISGQGNPPGLDGVVNYFSQTGSVPEPSSFVLAAIASCGLGLVISRRKLRARVS